MDGLNITPDAPATGAPSGHSSDAALSAWRASEPPKTDPAPAPAPTPAAAQPPATGAPAPGTTTEPNATTPAGDAPVTAVDDLAAVLGDDLKPPAAAVIDPNADPLETFKDHPRVQQLLQAESTVANLLTKSEYIKEAAHIEAAITDADVLWQITDGKQDPGVLLEAVKANKPEIYPQVIQQLKTYIERVTGQPIAAAAAGQVDPANMTPEQKRIAAIEKELNERKAADAKAEEQANLAAFNKRVETARNTVTAKVTELIKDSWLDGEGETPYLMSLLANKLAGKEQQLIDAVEKGDFKLIEAALKQVRSDEAKRFEARSKRIAAMKGKKVATIPVQASGGSPASSGAPAANAPLLTKDQRIAAARAELNGTA
jgi:hypothetical protein